MPGAVVVLNPTTHTVVRIMPIPFGVTICAGPQGMAIGPDPQILLGCNAPTSINGGTLNGPQNSIIINAGVPNACFDVAFSDCALTDQGGSDQVWFEPGSAHYFLANGSHLPTGMLGVVDSNIDHIPEIDQSIFIGFSGSTTRRAHSVAAWSGSIGGNPLTAAFLPVPPVGGTPAPFSSVVCHPIETSGCVAVFVAPGIGEPFE